MRRPREEYEGNWRWRIYTRFFEKGMYLQCQSRRASASGRVLNVSALMSHRDEAASSSPETNRSSD